MYNVLDFGAKANALCTENVTFDGVTLICKKEKAEVNKYLGARE